MTIGHAAMWALAVVFSFCAFFGETASSESTSPLYIVHVSSQYPPAAAYEGGISGFAATTPHVISGLVNRLTGRPRLNSRAGHVRAYTSFLRQLHRTIAGSVKLPLSNIVHSYDLVLNGFSARLSPSAVAQLRQHPLVAAVVPSRIVRPALTRSLDFLNIPSSLWAAAGGDANAGAGVVVGIIDTGIWPENPFFSDADFTSATPPSTWTGKCNSTSDFPSSLCNKKLIGANYFYAGAQAYGDIDLSSDWLSPRDAEGHGTWCASASAGSRATTVSMNSNNLGTASGMAPRAFLAAYKAFWTTTNGQLQGGAVDADLFAAINQAVADGVDVLSCSWGGPIDDYIASSQYLFLNAAKAGVFTAMAAGNDGPPPLAQDWYPTVSNPAPFYLTVGASTIDRSSSTTLTYGASSTVTVPSSFSTPAAATASLVLSSSCGKDGANTTEISLCYNNTLDSTKCSGKIILCDRGDVYLLTKSAAVQAAGGAGIIIGNVEGGATTQYAVDPSFPSVNLLLADAQAVKQYIQSTASPTASISAAHVTVGNEAPFLASFSSRGPLIDPLSLQRFSRSNFTNDILKPDILGPGVELVGAARGDGLSSNTNKFAILSGTSMATPHLAGIAALIMQAHPKWSPSQVKSAIMTTAYTKTNKGNPITDDAGASVTPWDTGSGHVDCTKASDPGLTYDTSFSDYVNFLFGRQPHLARQVYSDSKYHAIPGYQLNYPNIVVSSFRQRIVSVKRTVTNVGGADAVYQAAVVAPGNARVIVSPSTLSVKAGGTASYTVIFVVKFRSRRFAFGSLTWADGKGHSVRSVLGLQAVRL